MKSTLHHVEGTVVLLEEESLVQSEPLFSKESLAKRDEVVIIRGHIQITP